MALEKEDEEPAGDPDPNLNPDPDAGKETGDPAPGGKPGEGEGEEKDERGVPFKNVVAEAERKRKKAEDDLIEERARREQAERQAATLAAAIPAQPPKKEESLSELRYSDPDEYDRRIVEQAKEGARQTTRWEMSQQATYKKVFDDFPELKDTASDFAREVAVEYDNRKRYHGLKPEQHDAVLLSDAANKVEIERSKAAKRKAGAAQPLAPTMEGGRGGGGGGGRSTPKKGELTPERRKVADALGFTEDEAKDAYTHYLPEDANV
jgi:hypothetical protein